MRMYRKGIFDDHTHIIHQTMIMRKYKFGKTMIMRILGVTVHGRITIRPGGLLHPIRLLYSVLMGLSGGEDFLHGKWITGTKSYECFHFIDSVSPAGLGVGLYCGVETSRVYICELTGDLHFCLGASQ